LAPFSFPLRPAERARLPTPPGGDHYTLAPMGLLTRSDKAETELAKAIAKRGSPAEATILSMRETGETRADGAARQVSSSSRSPLPKVPPYGSRPDSS